VQVTLILKRQDNFQSPCFAATVQAQAKAKMLQISNVSGTKFCFHIQGEGPDPGETASSRADGTNQVS
jgi:hypothetical protein